MIVFRIYIELVGLLRTVLSNMVVSNANGTWLELKAADFAKKRKAAIKTQGKVTLSRETPGEAVTIPKGQVFKTTKDINGDELRYFSLADTILKKDSLSVEVLVEAEIEGSRYNVPQGQIINSLTHIEGVDTITNGAEWITTEGSDIEELESLRSRVLNSWAELSTLPIADKYKNVCEAVPGVLFVRVDDQHPRGQGTVDIIVTGTAGEATEGLIALVQAAADAIKGPYDDVLVKSSITVAQAISVTVTVSASIDTDGLEDRVTSALTDLLKIQKNRNLNELTIADIIFTVKSKVSEIQNVKVTAPAEDVLLESDKIVIAGEITVTVQKV
nr:MAG TPA: Baseplate J like protein [Caudoviricetes sp.]